MINKTFSAFKEYFIKLIKGDTLYKQAAAVKGIFVSFPYESCFNFTMAGRKLNVNYRGLMTYIGRDYFDVYFPRRVTYPLALFYLGHLKKAPQVYKRLHTQWKKYQVKNLLKIIDEVEANKLSRLKNNQLSELFNKFAKIYHKYWSEAILLDTFDVEGPEILEKANLAEINTLTKSQMNFLTLPESLSWLQKEQENRLIIIKKIKRQKKLLKLVRQSTDYKSIEYKYPTIALLILKHSQHFHWLHNDYIHSPRLGPQHYYHEIRILLLDSKESKRVEKQIIDVKAIHKRKQLLLKRLGVSNDMKHLLNAFVVFAAWRDDRKSYQQMANAVIKEFVQELVKRTILTKSEAEYVFWWEYGQVLKRPKHFRSLLRDRKRGRFYMGPPSSKKDTISGQAAQKINRYLKNYISQLNSSLKGTPAHAGKARGKAYIILAKKDFSKMKPGGILIAPNTRPEYVPVMKIAAGIITEEGGMTSHAAIVSRELKIPCLVGVQAATAYIKNGDKIEVDAIMGVVRKL
ncbi:PEP-utilizing enzyme [Patescibacteria group bacterium]